MSALIYIETSIPSFYHETRTEAQFQAMREWTREWWDIARLRDELVTSEAVLRELGRAPEAKRTDGLALLEPLPLLDIVDAVDELVAAYLAHRLMPRDAEGDAMHLALATFHECDILATWNCHRPPALLAHPPTTLVPSSSSALRAKAPPFGYLAPLGCRHIANVNKREHIHRVNVSLGFATPLLTTPFELLEQLP